MGVLEAIAGEQERDPAWTGINPHGLIAVLGEFFRGRVNANQALDAMGLAGADRAEVQVWVAGFPRTDPGGNSVTREKIHDVLNALEQGLYTVAKAKTELDWA